MNAADLAGEVVSRWELLVEEVRRRLGPGAHLESAPREFFARRLGYDLGGAAIHRGPFAGRLAAGVGAEALAAGSHVVGDEAALNPDTAQGAALLGHELTHVVQQVAPLPLAPVAVRTGRPASSAPPLGGADTGGAVVQRAETGGEPGGGEAPALAAERAVLQEAQANASQRPRRLPPDPEVVAERVYQRLVDELILERERAAQVG